MIIYEGSITYKTSLSNYINEIIITDDVPSKNIDNFKKDSLEFMTKRQAIDKATDNGVIKDNTRARYKSRLTKAVNAM